MPAQLHLEDRDCASDLISSDPISSDLIRSGDAERIAEHFYPLVRSFVRSIVRSDSPELIETAAADTLLAIARHGPAFRGHARPATWIYQIARRKAWACLRREAEYRARTCSTEDPAVSCEIEVAVSVSIDPCAREIALELLAALVPNHAWRRVWLLANDPDLRLSDAEVAAALGYSPGSVAVIRSKVKQQIRTAMTAPRRRQGGMPWISNLSPGSSRGSASGS